MQQICHRPRGSDSTHAQIPFDFACAIVDAQHVAGRARFAELGAKLRVGVRLGLLRRLGAPGIPGGTTGEPQTGKEDDADGSAERVAEVGQFWQHGS